MMSDKAKPEPLQHFTSARHVASLPARERLGLVIVGDDMPQMLAQIIAADAAGVHQIWRTQSAGPDTLTLFGAASVRTQQIRMGTAIIPTYPRHPMVMAQQALAIAELSSNRLRLGIGPSHKPHIEGAYGLPQTEPLRHLREYMQVVRTALETGRVDLDGSFFHVHMSLSQTMQIPLLLSALRPKSFQLAGEIADGALSWNCPIPYLLEKALPALRAGAEAAQREAPPLVAHVLVALDDDQEAITAAVHKHLASAARLPFYARLFAEAGMPVSADSHSLDTLAQTLVISGNEQTVRSRFLELLDNGLDELLLMLLPIKDESQERSRLIQLIASV